MKIYRPAALLMYLEVFFSFFIGGLLYAAWIEAGKGQRLAAGAIVLSYGVGFAVIAFILSIIAVVQLNKKTIIKINWIMGGLLLVLFVMVSLQQKKKAEERTNSDFGIHIEHFKDNPYAKTVALKSKKK